MTGSGKGSRWKKRGRKTVKKVARTRENSSRSSATVRGTKVATASTTATSSTFATASTTVTASTFATASTSATKTTTATKTATAKSTKTATATATKTATATAAKTATATAAKTATATAAKTATATATKTATANATANTTVNVAAFGYMAIASTSAALVVLPEEEESKVEKAKPAEQKKFDNKELDVAFDRFLDATNYFFNNDHQRAFAKLSISNETSMYDSLGTAILKCFDAALTFDKDKIAAAMGKVDKCLDICKELRRRWRYSCGVKKLKFVTLTDLEAHAELCFAEVLLLKSVMTLIEENSNRTIMAVKWLKNSCEAYKSCINIMEKKWTCPQAKMQFRSGSTVGRGILNILIPLIPPKMITYMELSNYTGNRLFGLDQLRQASEEPGLRSLMADLIILSYNFYVCNLIDYQIDFSICSSIIDKNLKRFPNSIYFKYYKARLELLTGSPCEALVSYQACVNSNNSWSKLKHIGTWEMIWSNCAVLDWRKASKCSNILLSECPWSPLMFSYIKAATLLQIREQLTSSEKREIHRLLGMAPKYKPLEEDRVLSVEKHMISRCYRSKAQGNRLILPGIELLWMWDLIPVLGNDPEVVKSILEIVQRAKTMLINDCPSWSGGYIGDNTALVHFLCGCCHVALEEYNLGNREFEIVLMNQYDVKEDKYLIPWALYEMSMNKFREANYEEAKDTLRYLKKRHVNYAFEARLDLKIQARLEEMKSLTAKQH